MRTPFKRAKTVTADTARRITGISLPIGGLQWADPGPSDGDRVRGFLTELEDRRVLYNPDWLEVRSQVDRIRPVRAALFVAVSRAHKRARVSELKDGYEPGNAV